MRTKGTTKKNGKGRNGNGAKKGRPSYYDEETTPNIAFEVCLLFGAIDAELCKVLGIKEPTLYEWKKKYPDFADAIKRGKDLYDSTNVEATLLKKAEGYEYTKKLYRFSKKKMQMVAYEETVYVAPDITAIIFFLTNRNPERWKHVNRTITTGAVQHNHKHTGEVKIDDSAERAAKVARILRESGAVFSFEPGSDSGSKATSH